MTENEKRAHDLAIAVVAGMIANANERTDAYTLYMSAYHAALESFNRDFPQKTDCTK